LENNEFNDTMRFKLETESSLTAQDILLAVYDALLEKGYDPINQIVGYIISGDPTYVTSYNNARHLVRRVERDELLEEMVRFYISKHTHE